jgi:hypothetical protein
MLVQRYYHQASLFGSTGNFELSHAYLPRGQAASVRNASRELFNAFSPVYVLPFSSLSVHGACPCCRSSDHVDASWLGAH